jgi:hypothetical protein
LTIARELVTRKEPEAGAHSRWLLLFTALAFVPLSLLHGQNAVSGALTWKVTDPSGALIPSALIELRDNAKDIVRIASSNFSVLAIRSSLNLPDAKKLAVHMAFDNPICCFYEPTRAARLGGFAGLLINS